MTDSSSDNKPMIDMPPMMGMDATKMTHLLRIGTFQMEISPNDGVDVREFFSETIDKLISAYGEKLLEIDVKGIPMQSSTTMHG
jgi:hypothetical protein